MNPLWLLLYALLGLIVFGAVCQVVTNERGKTVPRGTGAKILAASILWPLSVAVFLLALLVRLVRDSWQQATGERDF